MQAGAHDELEVVLDADALEDVGQQEQEREAHALAQRLVGVLQELDQLTDEDRAHELQQVVDQLQHPRQPKAQPVAAEEGAHEGRPAGI